MTTILADFTMIVGDVPVQVPITQGIARVTLPPFDTGGRLKFAQAILIFSIRLLGRGESADVFVNEEAPPNPNALAGFITGSQSDEFRTQFITFTGRRLKGDQGKKNTLNWGT